MKKLEIGAIVEYTNNTMKYKTFHAVYNEWMNGS